MLKQITMPLVVLTITAASAVAGGKRVTAHVEGLACPFCTYNLEKRIKTLDAVPERANWDASVKKGLVRFDWKADVPFDPDAVREQIRKAGFTPGKIETTPTGGKAAQKEKPAETKTIAGPAEIVSSEEKPDRIRLGEDGSQAMLRRAERIDRVDSYKSLLRYLRTHANEKKPIRVRVTGVAPDDQQGVFLVHRWRPTRYASSVLLGIDDLVCQRCSTATMRTLSDVDGVIHVEADHQEDRVRVWSRAKAPDVQVLRKRIEEAGFQVTHTHVRHPEDTSDDHGEQ